MNGQLSTQIVPAWYELSFQKDSIIQFRVHRTALAEMEQSEHLNWNSAPIVSDFKKRYGLSTFIPPGNGDCGFNEVFKRGDSDHSDWIIWNARLPKMKSQSQEDSLEYLLALRTTIYLFISNRLWLFKGATDSHQKQLLMIESFGLPTGDRSFGQGALSITLSPVVIQWISTQTDNGNAEKIKEALITADSYIWEGGSKGRGRFSACIREPKWINLDIPGNACGLDPSDYHNESLDEGYTLHPHNVDSGLQQLTFLAGIARLHDLVRASKT